MPVWCLNIFCTAALCRSVSGCCHGEWWEWSCCRSISRERRGDPEELSPSLWFPAGGGAEIYTLIINLLWPHLSSGLPQHSAWVDQPDPRAHKPQLFAVMNGQWAIDGRVSKWKAPSWVGCCSPVRIQTERASCFSQDWSWPFFRSVWIICLTSWEGSTEWLFTYREAFDWHVCRPLRRQRSCPLYFFAGDIQQHAVLFTTEY